MPDIFLSSDNFIKVFFTFLSTSSSLFLNTLDPFSKNMSAMSTSYLLNLERKQLKEQIFYALNISTITKSIGGFSRALKNSPG